MPFAALLAMVALAPLACRSRPAPAAAGRAVSDSLLLAATGGDGWLTHGRDYGNTRYAPHTGIDAGSVARLARLWEFDARGSFRAGPKNESTPLVLDDLLIFTAAGNLVLALDARTGAERWRYKPVLKPVALCCGMVNRGVTAYGDRIFLAAIDARVIALRRSDGYSFTMAPLAAAGKIIVGASGGEFGIRGSGRQPPHHLAPRPRRRHRRAPLASPDAAPQPLGPRCLGAAGAARHGGGGGDGARRGPRRQDRLGPLPRPPHRPAAAPLPGADAAGKPLHRCHPRRRAASR
jgi:hypothetical protein